jgi:hypothetical protein
MAQSACTRGKQRTHNSAAEFNTHLVDIIDRQGCLGRPCQRLILVVEEAAALLALLICRQGCS